MRRFASSGDSATSKPPTATLPSVGGMKPVIIRMVVDLPAPFGPRKPRISPRSTENVTPATARFVPKCFSRFSTLIIVTPVGPAEWGRNNIRGRKRASPFPAQIHYIFVRVPKLAENDRQRALDRLGAGRS